MNHEGNILHGGPPLFSLTYVFKVKLSVLAALFHHLKAILTSICFISPHAFKANASQIIFVFRSLLSLLC